MENSNFFIYNNKTLFTQLKEIITRTDFNSLMKYENVEFERNFQLLKSTEQSVDESTSANSSVCAQSRTEKSHDDIQVRNFERYFKVLSREHKS